MMSTESYRRKKGIDLDAPRMTKSQAAKRAKKVSPWGRYPMIDQKIEQSWKSEPCRKCNKFNTEVIYDENHKIRDIVGQCRLKSNLFGKPEKCWEYITEAGVDG